MTETPDRCWTQTYSGGKFHILDPCVDEVHIEDIAHALSLLCRFTGHTRKFYSVGQHCVHASEIVDPTFALEALLHDASEAYIGDMSRPLKHYTNAGKAYLEVEARIEAVIAEKFGLPRTADGRYAMSPEVKAADNTMLYTEKVQLMPKIEWDTRWGTEKAIPNFRITPWRPEETEQAYLWRFSQLTGK